ncbi:MAG: hypothetical protein Q8Q09_08440 [Deltaproteobacteria bacterium]|nr:hypothetical protein [Deltaproteobacteria bacterium]
MSTTPQAEAAATARQRLAGVLGSLQTDPNLPQGIAEIVSGLAGAIGPLFKLERGDPDSSLFIQARTVLQETLGKMQTVDQMYPGVSDATQAIASTLGIIFGALQAAAAAPAPAAAPAAAAPTPVAAAPVAPAPAPVAPVAPAPAPVAPVAPVAPAVPVAPVASLSRSSQAAMPATGASAPVTPSPSPSATGSYRALLGSSIPNGPNGVPRLETEVDVHSDTNFFTDFFGDIRSNGGIFVSTYHVMSLGTACEIALTFPGGLSAEIRGVVRFVRNNTENMTPGLGIAITQAPPEAWSLIERFVQKREPIVHDV